MVTYDATRGAGTIVRLPTRTELRAMLDRPAVAITAIVAVAIIVLAFVGALVYLTDHGRSTEALTFAVVAPIIGLLVSIGQRVKSAEKKIDAINNSPADTP